MHRAGARVLWDLSYTVGAVPIDLDATRTDFAVGRTDGYLNGAPGAPAFLYVRVDLIARCGPRDGLPVSGAPARGIERFLSGTPSVLAATAVEEGVRVVAEAGIDRLRKKSAALTALAATLAERWLTEFGFTVASPRDPSRRGAQQPAGRGLLATRQRRLR